MKNGLPHHDTGTGFIITADGYVLTCNHLLPPREYDKLTISGSIGDRNGQVYPLELIQPDSNTDLALLKIESTHPWTPVRICASTSAMEDDAVFALGYPLLENLSGAPGSITSKTGKNGHWRTNAPLNHGMSGGPVFNVNGDVVGIAAAGQENAQLLNDMIPVQFAFTLLGRAAVVGTCGSAPSEQSDASVLMISATPRGDNWPGATLAAAAHLSRLTLSEGDRRILLEEFRKGRESLFGFIRLGIWLTDAQADTMTNITRVLYELQRVVDVPQEWEAAYNALQAFRPRLLGFLNIPRPSKAEAPAAAHGSALQLEPLSASVAFDPEGPFSDKLVLPPLKSPSTADASSTIFTIHAITQVDAGAGPSVQVWITPGMTQADGTIVVCHDGKTCGGDMPASAVFQQLFASSLNDALSANGSGLGQYFVTKCDDPPITRDYGWLDVAARVAVGLDARYSYTITNFDRSNRRAGTRTAYYLGVDHISPECSRARFVPTQGSLGREALEYVWGLCEARNLDEMVFVTTVHIPELTYNTRSPEASRF